MNRAESQRKDATGRQLLFGLQVDALRMEQVIDQCKLALSTRRQLLIGVINAAKVVEVQNNDLLRASLFECDVLLADGQAVVWASKFLGHPLPERVAGIDLFERLLELAHRHGRSVYLLGAKAEVLECLQEKLRQRYPGLKIAGSHHGYFAESEGAEIAAEIRKSGADMLFLGITSPKKEKFLGAFKEQLNVPVLHGVGGSFDVMAGVVKRAPPLWQRLGLEWAYRFAQEPARMWRRYLIGNTRFIMMTLREWFMASPPFWPSTGADLALPHDEPGQLTGNR
jgi:N-acetylglucosaminyldiphosphoundecaprenol N-acetyl-beta-D-mannosaminyltransferase